MRILINASTVKIAGGLAIVHNFLNAYNINNHNHNLLVIAPENCNYEQFESENVKISLVSNILLKKYKRFYLKNVWIKNVVSEFKPDVIFSFSNIPLKTGLPQAMLLSNPFVIVKDLVRINVGLKERIKQNLRTKFFKRKVKFVDLFFVQTEVIKNRFVKYYQLEAEIHVIPMASSILKTVNENIWKNLQITGKKKLLCLSRYYEHKNLEILISVAKIIKKNNSRFLIIITIEKEQNVKARKLINNIAKFGLEDVILNIGNVKQENIKELYEKSDALILPTLLESHSATYPDTMLYGKPIFTSGLDFAKEACGDVAYYFNPLDAEDIYNTILDAFQNIGEMQKKIIKGIERVNKLPDWTEITRLYINKLEKMCNE